MESKTTENFILSVNDTYKDYETLFIENNHSISDIKNKIEEVQLLIEHVNHRIEYTETRITRTVSFSLTLILIGMAFFAVSIKLEGLSFYAGLSTTLLFILTGGLTSLIHALQINPKYPFRALSNDWKWFYSNIVDEQYKPNLIVKDKDTNYWKKRLSHVYGLKNYAEKLLNENQHERLKIDIQQLYLLHVNEKYKNVFLSDLRSILFWGLSLISISLTILFIIIIYNKICTP